MHVDTWHYTKIYIYVTGMPELKRCYWETFINLVRPRTAIWDIGSKEYMDRNVSAKNWQDIFNELNEVVSPEDRVFSVSDLKERWGALRGTYRRNKAKLRSKKSGMAASEVSKVKWPYFRQLCFLESGSAELVTASSSLQSRDASDISIIPVTEESIFAEELPDIDDPAAISTEDHSNVATSIVIDLPPAMEEQDDEEDNNVDNVVQTTAESRQSSSQPWTPEMQRRKRKRHHQEAAKSKSQDIYSATMAMLSSADKEDICDQYGKTIASELRARILEKDRSKVFRKMLQVIDDFIDDQDI